MPDDACDLDLMHRIDHRRGGTGPAEHLAHRRQIGERGAAPAKLRGDKCAEHARFTQRSERLIRETGTSIDIVCRRTRDLRANPASGVDEVTGRTSAAHTSAPINSSTAVLIAAIVANVLRRNIRSGNST